MALGSAMLSRRIKPLWRSVAHGLEVDEDTGFYDARFQVGTSHLEKAQMFSAVGTSGATILSKTNARHHGRIDGEEFDGYSTILTE